MKKPSFALVIGAAPHHGDGPDEEAGGDAMGLEAAMEELRAAFKSGDNGAAAEAFRNAFAILESEPHEEAEH